MRSVWKREWKSYFHTPVGYVFIGVFLLISSVMFFLSILKQHSGDLPVFIGNMSYLWMLLSPILTMRLMAEERQKKTEPLLLTSPVSPLGIVLGKYMAAVSVLWLTGGLTLFYVSVVAIYGTVYPKELAVNYLGFILQGCAFVAVDMYMSERAETPVTAAVMAFGANLILWMMDLLENQISFQPAEEAIRFLSLYHRNEAFLMGQLSFAGMIYDLCFVCAFIALTVHHMNRRRRGRNRK